MERDLFKEVRQYWQDNEISSSRLNRHFLHENWGYGMRSGSPGSVFKCRGPVLPRDQTVTLASKLGDVVSWRRHSHFSRVSSSAHQLPRDCPGERRGPCTEPGGPSSGLWWPHGWERWQRGGCFRGAGRGSGPTGEQQDRLCQCHVLPPQRRTSQSHWIGKDRQIFMPTLA